MDHLAPHLLPLIPYVYQRHVQFFRVQAFQGRCQELLYCLLLLALLEENDQILSDIGFERMDIQWALELPLKVDALKALAACRRAR